MKWNKSLSKLFQLETLSYLNILPAAVCLLLEGPLEDEEPVQVDEDKVVDGGAHENDHQAGDGTAHLSSEPPEVSPPAHLDGLGELQCISQDNYNYLLIRRVLKGKTTPQSMSLTAREMMIRLYLCSSSGLQVTVSSITLDTRLFFSAIENCMKNSKGTTSLKNSHVFYIVEKCGEQ